MGVEEAVRGGGGGGNNLALASIGFADVRVGAAGGGAVYKDGLLVVGLPGGDGLDVAGAVPHMAVRLPDVGAAFRVRSCRSQCPS